MSLYFVNISLDGARDAKSYFKGVMCSKVYKAFQEIHYFQVCPCGHRDLVVLRGYFSTQSTSTIIASMLVNDLYEI